MLKSRLQKLHGLTHTELKENIIKTIRNIPKDKYKNIIKGAYERQEKTVYIQINQFYIDKRIKRKKKLKTKHPKRIKIIFFFNT
jgi:hypothetical protein